MLALLLLLSLIAIPVFYFWGNVRFAGAIGMVFYGLMLLLVVLMAPGIAAGTPVPLGISFNVLGATLDWHLDGLGWFFALLTTGAAFFVAWYMSGEWNAVQAHPRIQHGTLALNVFSMLLLVSSGDFLTLFIGWELVSWGAFAMMAQAGGKALEASLRYLLYALSGAMALFAGIVLVHQMTGSFAFAPFAEAIGSAAPWLQWTLFGLFVAGFGVKMAVFPLHLWQAPAYAETPGASSAFLNAVSARMGLFALILVVIKLMAPAMQSGLHIPYMPFGGHEVLLWITVITMVVPTYIALQQTDARMLLAWHGIGQGGYMLLGLLVGSPLGVAGGLLHTFNYATYQMALVFAVFAVMHRTRTADLDELGGLINRMPFTYITLLLGIIGLAGLPPMNGFVSKWMIYKSLLNTQQPLLTVFAFIGTLGTILSVYKLIHNMFLGQLRVEHQDVKEAPLSMLLPMLTLGIIGFITGYFPGLALSIVDIAQNAIGVAPIAHTLGGISLPRGSLNMIWVVSLLLFYMGIAAFIFYVIGNKHIKVHQYNNYAGGHFLSADIRYHYSHEFYPGLVRVIGPYYRGWVVKTERALVGLANVGGDLFRGIFRHAATPLYLLAATTLGLIWVSLYVGV